MTVEKGEKFSFFKWFKSRLKHFCSVTALHGYGHIIREGSPLWERILWVFVVAIALIASIILLVISWQWNSEIPVVTVIESTHYATWNIPFPAITICSLNKISAISALEAASKLNRLDNTTDEELVDLFSILIHFQSGFESSENYTRLDDILKLNNVSVEKLAEDISPKCSEMLERCMWKGTQARCDTLFQTISTMFGQCCSFNYYGLEKNNYPAKIIHSIPKEPRRVTACGYQSGLSVIISSNNEDYHSTVIGSYGLRVLVHNSYDFPDQNAETKIITSRLESFMSVAPEATYNTEDVSNLAVDVRNCYRENEVKLTVFQKYTYLNCMAECRSKVVFDRCGCVPYTMANNGSFPICQINKLSCFLQYKTFVEGAYPGLNNSISMLHVPRESTCDCLPDCASIQYPTEISTAYFTRNNSYNSKSFFKDVVLTDQSLIHVFFNDLVSTRYRKDIYQNWLGVLATFGGILGLFLGFSLITGFELIYLFTLRILFDQIVPSMRKDSIKSLKM